MPPSMAASRDNDPGPPDPVHLVVWSFVRIDLVRGQDGPRETLSLPKLSKCPWLSGGQARDAVDGL